MGDISKFDHATSCANVQQNFTVDHRTKPYRLILYCTRLNEIVVWPLKLKMMLELNRCPEEFDVSWKLSFAKFAKRKTPIRPFQKALILFQKMMRSLNQFPKPEEPTLALRILRRQEQKINCQKKRSLKTPMQSLTKMKISTSWRTRVGNHQRNDKKIFMLRTTTWDIRRIAILLA